MMSKTDFNMSYGTRSGVSHAGREVKKDAGDVSCGLNGFTFYEKKLHEIEKATDVPKAEKTRTPQISRGSILYFGTTSSVTYKYESDASNEDSESDQEDDSVKSDVSVKDESEFDENDTSVNSGSDADANEADEVEETNEDLDEAILAGVDDLLARVNVTLTKEERCWYELEAPHCRNRRLPFILRSELDVLDSVKNREIKEMFETLTEIASHYKDSLAREKALEEENTQLKARLKSNTNIILGNIGYSYASDAEFYDDVMADA